MPTLTRLRSVSLEVVVFLCGAFVMIFEIIGSRVLSPFIGTSTYVWTSLIGVILASLSTGYWLGGKMADRRPDIRVLASVIFLAGGLVSLTAFIKEVALSFVASAPIRLELQSLLAALLLFAPASICLGIVTPYAVKLRMESMSEVGQTVGRLYALSTVGSILGTFAAGFFLIPFVGSIRTLYIISGGLIAASVLLVPFVVSTGKIAVLTLFALSIGWSEANAYMLREANDLHDIDTEYSRIQVYRSIQPRTRRPIEALVFDPYFVQSAIYLDSDEPALEYTRFFHLARHFRPGFRNAAVIGGAGYTLPRDLLRENPEIDLDVVEIDPRMTEIARRYFRLTDDPRMNIVHEDGRMFLNHAPAGSYDVVMLDAFGSTFSVPFQLTTVESVRQSERILKDDGVVIANLGSAFTGKCGLFLQAELATYHAVFPNAYLFKVNSTKSDEQVQNVILVATKTSFQMPLESPDPEIASLLDHIYRGEIPTNLAALTDDLAPVEYYSSIAQNIYLSDLVR
jgi:spermidine synthase